MVSRLQASSFLTTEQTHLTTETYLLEIILCNLNLLLQ